MARVRALAMLVLAIVMLLVLFPVPPANAAGSAETKVWVGAPFKGAYAGTNGRPATSLPGKHPAYFTVPGYSYKHDWSMDFYALAGTDVYLYAAPKNSNLNSQITAKVLAVRPGCASGRVGDGGYVVFVGIFHSGVRIGDISYMHVNPDFNKDGVTNTQDTSFRGSLPRWGGYIGKVGKYTNNTCWAVSTTSGHHLHLEFANVKNYSCYRNLAAGSVIARGEYMGYLGGAFATKVNSSCPAGA